jgi:hypothetical protein
MDPYLEGQVWAGFHHLLIAEINAALVPLVRPRYGVYVDERVYVSAAPSSPPSIVPDVLVAGPRFQEPGSRGGTAVLVAPLTVPLPEAEEVREAYLEIRRAGTDEVVAVIEVLSPTNKRGGSEGRADYLAKRGAVLRSRAHLVEIDLLRGGERLPMRRPLPPADYFVIVSRAGLRPDAHVWPLGVRDPLPAVPIPLTGGDPDVYLELKAALDTVYDRAGYDYVLDYGRDVEPPLDAENTAWAREVLVQAAGAQGL